tara:strand:+ start:184 stop:762 length:579 start_codon:yes stop_codon:yes gene_type:complete
MEIFRNDKLIGINNFYFSKENNLMKVKNIVQFKISIAGIDLMKVDSESAGIYKDDMLIKFNSKTKQNDKDKFVNLYLDQNQFIIDGSSFNGKTSSDYIIGNYWNHSVVKSEAQISPLSGSVKKQKVKFLGKENITLYGNNYSTLHFKILSSEDLPDDKKINLDIWYDEKTLLLLKVSYKKLGLWEYRLKNYE